MYSRKLALSQARQIRTCPPHTKMKDPENRANMAQHLAVCRHCRDAMDSMDGMERLAAALGRRHEDAPAAEAAAPGQIRYIRPEMGGWQEEYHYNPPLVVVLEVRNRISDDIRVAQIYDDPVLAAPGDLILGDDQTGAGDLFVECWNTYTLRAAHLGSVVGMVSSPVLEAIHQLEANPENSPSWAALPFPMQEDDPRRYFRELEVKTAFFFSARAAGELMAVLESSEIRLAYASPAELARDVRKKAAGIHLAKAPASFEEALAAPVFPEGDLPLAAADDTGKTITARRAVFEKGLLAAYEPVEAAVFNVHDKGGGRVGFTGRLPLQPKAPPARVVFRFAVEDGVLVEPAASHWDPQTGGFSVEFETSSREWRRLRIAILYEIDLPT